MLLRDLNGRVVIEDIAAWALDPSNPLPSGADQRARRGDPVDARDDPNRGTTAGLAEPEGSDTVSAPTGP